MNLALFSDHFWGMGGPIEAVRSRNVVRNPGNGSIICLIRAQAIEIHQHRMILATFPGLHFVIFVTFVIGSSL